VKLEDRLASARLTRFPERAEPQEYERASEELEEWLARLPGAMAIYRTGSVSVPGISDIDRIAVVNGLGPAPEIWSRLSPRTRYLAMHGPFLSDAETFARHRWFADPHPLTLAWGRPLAVEQDPGGELGASLLAAEGLVVAALRLAKQAVTGRVKVRPLLCELNTVKLHLELAGLDRPTAGRAWQLADDVTRLRTAWFGPAAGRRERIDALRSLLRDALPAVAEAVAALAARRSFDLDAGPQLGSLRLRGPWSNVLLLPGGGLEISVRRAVGGRALPRGAGRLAELRWRLARVELRLPTSVAALLTGADDAQAEFLRQRREIVRRYSEFMAASARDYSAIGLAAVFLPNGH
jgi:hypothetical protein